MVSIAHWIGVYPSALNEESPFEVNLQIFPTCWDGRPYHPVVLKHIDWIIF